MKQYEIIGKVLETEYKSISKMGNASKLVTVETENGQIFKGVTATNASCGLSCDNFINRQAKIVYHITRSGNNIIDYIHKVTK